MTSCDHFMEITEHSHHECTLMSHTAVIGLCCPHSLPHVTCLNNVTRDDVGEVQGLGLKCEIWFRRIQINGRLEAAKKNILEVETIQLVDICFDVSTAPTNYQQNCHFTNCSHHSHQVESCRCLLLFQPVC